MTSSNSRGNSARRRAISGGKIPTAFEPVSLKMVGQSMGSFLEIIQMSTTSFGSSRLMSADNLLERMLITLSTWVKSGSELSKPE